MILKIIIHMEMYSSDWALGHFPVKQNRFRRRQRRRRRSDAIMESVDHSSATKRKLFLPFHCFLPFLTEIIKKLPKNKVGCFIGSRIGSFIKTKAGFAFSCFQGFLFIDDLRGTSRSPLLQYCAGLSQDSLTLHT